MLGACSGRKLYCESLDKSLQARQQKPAWAARHSSRDPTQPSATRTTNSASKNSGSFHKDNKKQILYLATTWYEPLLLLLLCPSCSSVPHRVNAQEALHTSKCSNATCFSHHTTPLLHLQAVPASAFTRRSPHRPTQQPLDGPFPLQPGQVSTRVHNLDRFLLLRDSGLGPAAYDQGSSKDALARRAATAKVQRGTLHGQM